MPESDFKNNLDVLCKIQYWQKLYVKGKRLYINDLYVMQPIYRTLISFFNDSASINFAIDIIEDTLKSTIQICNKLIICLSDLYVSKNKLIYNTISKSNNIKREELLYFQSCLPDLVKNLQNIQLMYNKNENVQNVLIGKILTLLELNKRIDDCINCNVEIESKLNICECVSICEHVD